jgi:hypothetical protein
MELERLTSANVHSYLFDMYCTRSFVSELASAVKKNEHRRTWKFRHDLLKKATRFFERIDVVAWIAFVLWKEWAIFFDIVVSIALEH